MVFPVTPTSSPASPAERCPCTLATGKICPARAAVASPGRDRAVRVGSADGRVCSAAGDLDVPQAHMSDHDCVAIFELRLAHAVAVDEDAVEAAVVEQHGAPVAMNEHGVAAGHGRVLEQDVRGRTAPDAQPLPVAVAKREQDDLTRVLDGEIAAGRGPSHAG